ncbi:MAG: ABC transporter substrate-binding protein [Rariglobus sp.]
MKRALMVAGAAFALLAGGCSKNTENPDAPGGVLRFGFVGVGNPSGIPPGPVGWAYERGWLQEELGKIGIHKIELIPSGGPVLNQIFAAGGVDVFHTGDSPGIIGRGAGLKFRLINIDMLEYNLYFITRENGPRTMQELRGKTVAMGFASNTWHWVHGLLVKEGLSDDIKTVNVTGNEAEAALLRGDIDAMAVNFGPLYVKKGFRILAEAKDYRGLAGLYIAVGAEEFLKKNPRFAPVWNDVVARAVLDMREHPDEFYTFMTKTSRLPESALRELYPISLWNTEPLPARGMEDLEITKQFILSQKVFRGDFSLQEWVADGVPVGKN